MDAMNKKVFISYSWSSPAHEQWVLDLGQRLVNDGVNVVLDKWDLKPGHDKFAFMEQMVTAADIDKVLIVSDLKYSLKANGRDGGVGNETMIISPKVYESTTQEKFIPIVPSLDDCGKPNLPAYLEGKIYIDLSSNEHFEAEYEKLLRNIFQRPLQSKPKLGTPPIYIFEESPISFKTKTILRSFDSQMDRFPNRVNMIAKEFFEELIKSLSDFTIKNPSRTYIEFGEQAFNVINQMTPLRDDYIGFMEKLMKFEDAFQAEILVSFFENLTALLNPPEGSGSWGSIDFDHYKFIINELFIYTIAIALKRENYAVLEEMLHSRYFLKSDRGRHVESENYDAFYFYIESMDQYFTKINGGQKYLSAQAEFLVRRLPEDFKKSDFLEADLLCFYVAILNGFRWFAKTYIYRSEYTYSFGFFNRLVSLRHFEKVKGVLNVESVSDLKAKILALDSDSNNYRGYSSAFSRIQKLSSLVKPEEIGNSR